MPMSMPMPPFRSIAPILASLLFVCRLFALTEAACQSCLLPALPTSLRAAATAHHHHHHHHRSSPWFGVAQNPRLVVATALTSVASLKSLRATTSTPFIRRSLAVVLVASVVAKRVRGVGNTRLSSSSVFHTDSISSSDDEESATSEEETTTETNKPPVSSAMVATIGVYKNFISPLLPPACRFVPTCSQYGVQAIEEFGPTKGAILTAWRLLRCSPLGGKGYDPPKWPPVQYTYGSY
jgi:putative membrane protein insertion efficiency factor